MTKLKYIPHKDIRESLNRNCLTTQKSGSFLFDMVDFCDNANNEMVYELIPIRLVAYLEDVLRVKYELLLRQNDKIKELLEHNKIDVEYNKQLLYERLPISIQLAYSFGCNSLKGICKNMLLLTNIDINDIGRGKLGNDLWDQFKDNIDSLFKTRHLLCHESGFDVTITHKEARLWIQNIGVLLNVIDDAIIKYVYKDFFIFKNNMTDKEINDKLDENIKVAQKVFEDSEKAIDDIYKLSKSNNNYPNNHPNLEFILKWKEYRDLRVASDNIFPINSKQNLLFAYREKNQYNEGLLSEIRLQYRDFLNYHNNLNHKEKL